MDISVTPIYAGLTALIYLALCWHVIAYRRANLLSLGDEGDRNLLRRMRAQANCAEYAPIGVVLLLLAELQGHETWVLHGFGLCLVLGRALHGYGFNAKPMKFAMRITGMLLTLTQLGFNAILVLLTALF